MAWNDDLLPDQRKAVEHIGTHGRLIAGPGTGKTHVLTGRVVNLVAQHQVNASEILVLTFTRAAAQELRDRALAALGDQADQPRIVTLHAFALRQLLRNSNLITTLPAPLRIADDWEERWIVEEDLKNLLTRKVGEIQDAFHALSADWESLTDTQLERDPQFVGAWRQHREVYGYTLRAELVYELKRALEQVAGFSLDAPLVHLLVDEYQDLNKCDLAIVRALVNRGLELFIAGDDDQSIYGFRKAHPEGIRRFLDEYPSTTDLPLTVCVRCDKTILELAQFVAALDPSRLAKDLQPREGSGAGAVHLVRFPVQYAEAGGIAAACEHLIRVQGYEPHDILILLRSDRNHAYSRPIVQALQQRELPVALPGDDLLATNGARLVIALLRLCADRSDPLAWRTALRLRDNGIGAGGFQTIYDLAVTRGWRFDVSLRAIAEDPTLVARFGKLVADEVAKITTQLDAHCPPTTSAESGLDLAKQQEQVRTAIDEAIAQTIPDLQVAEPIRQRLAGLAETWGAKTVGDVLAAVEAATDEYEQAVQRGAINLLTMHRAKGLTAKAVFVAACEDEMIPGRQIGEDQVGDERRLLYVSLTRAKHFLCISYCEGRVDQQKNLGANPGEMHRTLCRFLRDAPIQVVSGGQFLNDLS